MTRTPRRRDNALVLLWMVIAAAIIASYAVAFHGWYRAWQKAEALNARTCSADMTIARIVNGQSQPLERFHAPAGSATLSGEIIKGIFITVQLHTHTPKDEAK